MSDAAVLYGRGQDVDVTGVRLGTVGDNDVVVSIKASGLCHSDVSVQDGIFELPLPLVLGHEGAGVVEEVGAHVRGVAVGDHVVVVGTLSCGSCRNCYRGAPLLCEWGMPLAGGCRVPGGDFRAHDDSGTGLYQYGGVGTLAETVIVNESAVVVVTPEVPSTTAALLGCAVLTGLGVVFNRARVRPGETVAVIGCGGIGLNAVQGARIAGASRIIAIDPLAEKRSIATDFGATDTVDPNSGSAVEQVMEITKGRGADNVFECVGRASLIGDGFAMAAMEGTVVSVGVSPTTDVVSIPAQALTFTHKTLTGCIFGGSRPQIDIPDYLEMYQRGRLKLDELLSRTYSLNNINDAIADLRTGVNTRGVIVFD